MVGMLCASLCECASELTELTLSGNFDPKSSQSWDDAMPRLAALVVAQRGKLRYLNLESSGITVRLFSLHLFLLFYWVFICKALCIIISYHIHAHIHTHTRAKAHCTRTRCLSHQQSSTPTQAHIHTCTNAHSHLHTIQDAHSSASTCFYINFFWFIFIALRLFLSGVFVVDNDFWCIFFECNSDAWHICECSGTQRFKVFEFARQFALFGNSKC